MKKFCIILIVLFIACGAKTQSCLPEGITFSTQNQVDSFKIYFPGCSEIEGNAEITGPDIANLNGLNVLTSVGGSLIISGNYGLMKLTGLDSVNFIGESLIIANGPTLSSMTGLDKLTFVGQDINISSNTALTSLIGLENISFIGGSLIIFGNTALNSLAGLDNIDGGSIKDLAIVNNSSLSICEVGCVCDYLKSPGGIVNVYGNSSGCNSVIELATACGGSASCLPGNYNFCTQADIDNFEFAFPDCTELEGMVTISGNDITNLDGLHMLKTIRGDLFIKNNDSLTDLSGLESLDTIAGGLEIGDNEALTSLTGLESLTEIGIYFGGDLRITNNNLLPNLSNLNNITKIGGGIYIYNNETLTGLEGLEHLAHIGGWLYIVENQSLTNIDGIFKINKTELSNLYLWYNPVLNSCAIPCVCYLIDKSPDHVTIQNNTFGCNTIEEVDTSCGDLDIYEDEIEPALSFYPNPAGSIITVSLASGPKTNNMILEIFDVNTHLVFSSSITYLSDTYDISSLIRGIYLIRVTDEKSLFYGKFIKF